MYDDMYRIEDMDKLQAMLDQLQAEHKNLRTQRALGNPDNEDLVSLTNECFHKIIKIRYILDLIKKQGYCSKEIMNSKGGRKK
jgi:hypothetical protein